MRHTATAVHCTHIAKPDRLVKKRVINIKVTVGIWVLTSRQTNLATAKGPSINYVVSK